MTNEEAQARRIAVLTKRITILERDKEMLKEENAALRHHIDALEQEVAQGE